MFKRENKKRKSKHSLISEFSYYKDNFKNSAISIDLPTLYLESINKIHELTRLPLKNEQIRIVTRKLINSFDFIQAILHKEDIKELTLATYRIGKKTVNQLYDIQQTGKIKKINFLINDGFPKLVPDCWNLLKTKESKEWKIKIENNHTKIILINTEKNKYVIEGSGNLSINARIEQYTFDNNKQIYDFHYNWIKKI